jgi:hypothetical protein
MNQPSKIGREKRFLLILDTETRKYLDELSEEATVSRAAFARLLIRAAYKVKQQSNINIVFDELKLIKRALRRRKQAEHAAQSSSL